MKALENALNRVCSALNQIGSYWVIGLMLIIVVDVLGRVFFNSPLRGTPEIVKNSIVGIAFFQIAFALLKQRHVRATIVYNRVSPRAASFIDIFSYLLGLILFIGVIVSSWRVTGVAFSLLEYEGEGALRVPTYPVRAIVILGSFLVALQCLRLLIIKVRSLTKVTINDKGVNVQ